MVATDFAVLPEDESEPLNATIAISATTSTPERVSAFFEGWEVTC